MESFANKSSLQFNSGLPPKSGIYYRKVWQYFAHQHRIALVHYDVNKGWEVKGNGEKYIGWAEAEN